jgi:hypothetical protein
VDCILARKLDEFRTQRLSAYILANAAHFTWSTLAGAAFKARI